MSETDRLPDELLTALDEMQLREKTIVVIWGDHGWKLGDYGRWSKHSNMEVDTRVPLILSVPGRSPEVLEEIIETIDLYPTLARLAGFEPPAHLQGEDLFDKSRNYALSQIPRDSVTGFSIRTPEYRYIEWRLRQQADSVVFTELYNHQNNHLETKNLLPDSAFTSTIRSLKQNMNF